NARPMLVGIDSWHTSPDIHYDNADLLDIWTTLLTADGVSDNPGYKYDVINVGRQVMGNLFSVMRDSFTVAYNQHNIPEMGRIAAVMNDLIIDSDSLLACDASFSLGKWIADARDFGITPEEKDYYEQNARGIVSVWGQKATQLNDYANRGWAGLTKDFYGARWNMFTNSVIDAVKVGTAYDAKKYYDDITEFEYQWTLRTGDDYPVVSDADPTQMAKQLINKYSKFITKKAD
ncbi:MAG: alpha-N-acetylglucosaminidase C-terminal domain-containing protein, partial [Muribaculaceae bacterium]|nr:alpha-N-acetylglucosaminidase C-terminal domain-containing protein [Muribaculaceae bacterium]